MSENIISITTGWSHILYQEIQSLIQRLFGSLKVSFKWPNETSENCQTEIQKVQLRLVFFWKCFTVV